MVIPYLAALHLEVPPRKSCRTFISRMKTLYESIEGKEDKPDNANKTAMEDTLREKVRKMRDEVLIKILLQGILPKFFGIIFTNARGQQ